MWSAECFGSSWSCGSSANPSSFVAVSMRGKVSSVSLVWGKRIAEEERGWIYLPKLFTISLRRSRQQPFNCSWKAARSELGPIPLCGCAANYPAPQGWAHIDELVRRRHNELITLHSIIIGNLSTDSKSMVQGVRNYVQFEVAKACRHRSGMYMLCGPKGGVAQSALSSC